MVRIILKSTTAPRPEERAPERLSKDARVSKDGHKRDRVRGHPSRRPRQERGLLRMRSEGGECDFRYDWFHGIDELISRFSAPNDCSFGSNPDFSHRFGDVHVVVETAGHAAAAGRRDHSRA